MVRNDKEFYIKNVPTTNFENFEISLA